MSKRESEGAPPFPVELNPFYRFWRDFYSGSGLENFDDERDEERFEDRAWWMIHLFFKWLSRKGFRIRPREGTSFLPYDLFCRVGKLEEREKRLGKEYIDKLDSMKQYIENLEEPGKEREELILIQRREIEELKEALKKDRK